MGEVSQTSRVPEIGSVIAQKYRVVRHIGAGGMGLVLEAEHTRTGKRVALKCLYVGLGAHPEARQRFLLEARACARVRHPNVVDVYDVVEEPDNAFMVMELLEGESLGSLLARCRLKPRRFIGLLLAAMRGVSAAHKQGVIHRDVKPDNIFLARLADRGPTPIVLDFGLSKLKDDPERLALTHSGVFMGTLLYTSPEQLQGAADVDQRTDVYAFGVILYEGLAGRLPYQVETGHELLARMHSCGPTPLRELVRGIPSGLEEAVMSALAIDPADRTPTLDALISQLEPYVHRASFRRPRSKRAKRAKLLYALAPLTAVLLWLLLRDFVGAGSASTAPRAPVNVVQPAPPEPAPPELDTEPAGVEPQLPEPQPELSIASSEPPSAAVKPAAPNSRMRNRARLLRQRPPEPEHAHDP